MTTLADDSVVDGNTATLAGTADDAGATGASPTSSGPIDRLLTTGWWPAIMFGFGALVGAGPISDNSFLTHLATGRLILDKGVPTSDPYSFVAAGRPWVVQSWLASWVLALADRVGGFALIRCLVALVTGLLVLCIWELTAPAKQLAGRLALCGLSVIAGLHYWSERPQTLAFLMAAVVLWILSTDRPTWWIAPLAAIWINVHGSFPLLAALIGGWWIVRSIEQHAVRRREIVAGGWALLGITVGALVSPFGTGLIEFPFRMVGRTEVLKYILEWRSPQLSDSSTWFAVLLGVVALVVLGRDRRWARVVVGLLFAAAAAWSARNVPFAALMLVVLAAPSFASIGTLRPADPPPVPSLLRGFAIAAVLVTIGILVTPDVDLSPYPVASISWADQAGLLSAPGSRLISHDYVGNYLELAGPHPVDGIFIDDRAEVFNGTEIGDYVRLLTGDATWSTILDRYGATVVIWDAEAPLAGLLGAPDSGWQIVHRDDVAVVATRTSP